MICEVIPLSQVLPVWLGTYLVVPPKTVFRYKCRPLPCKPVEDPPDQDKVTGEGTGEVIGFLVRYRGIHHTKPGSRGPPGWIRIRKVFLRGKSLTG